MIEEGEPVFPSFFLSESPPTVSGEVIPTWEEEEREREEGE